MNGANTIYLYIFDQGTINRGKRDSRTIRIVYLNILHLEITETTTGHCSKFQSAGTRTAYTVLDHHILTHTVRIVRFGTKGIIRRIKKRIFQHDAVTVHNIDPVVVPIGFTIDVYAVDIQIFALIVGLVPTCRVPQGNIFDRHILAFAEINILRTVRLVRTTQFQRVFVDTSLDIVHHIVGGLKTTPVNCPLPRYTDILLLDCENHRHPVNIRIFFVIPGIGRSQ